MPYIKQELRSHLDSAIEELGNRLILSGDYNYAITRLLDMRMRDINHFKTISYQSINDVIGILECAKLEFYRRVASPYEDIKMKENGDVYRDKP